MDNLEALILGVLQGLTEYLPVSSSGHLAIGSEVMGIDDPSGNLTFAVLVHAATALSSIIIFRKFIWAYLKGLLKFQWNEETKYVAMVLGSAVPVVIVGLAFKDELEALFAGNVILVGAMWLVTAALLYLTVTVKEHNRDITWGRAIIIGLAQAVAVLPGISRSGATISAALLMKVDREKAARFSFLMVILPILGQAALDAKDLLFPDDTEAAVQALIGSQTEVTALVIGFVAAFVTGLLACSWMLRIVKKGNLHYFAWYCAIMGLVAIGAGSGIFG